MGAARSRMLKGSESRRVLEEIKEKRALAEKSLKFVETKEKEFLTSIEKQQKYVNKSFDNLKANLSICEANLKEIAEKQKIGLEKNPILSKESAKDPMEQINELKERIKQMEKQDPFDNVQKKE